MDDTYWHKQADKPLFEDLVWNKPENRQQAGKLLIIGGNAHEFAAPAEAYSEAQSAGVGTAKVLLPSALQKIIGAMIENTEFGDSTSTGSFSRKALADWIEWAHWADGVLLAGDLGRNSETAIVLESFIEKYPGQITINKDAVDYFAASPLKLLNRENTTIVVSLSQLQKLCQNAKWPAPITFAMPLVQLVEQLHAITESYSCNLVTEHNGILFVAVNGQVSTTRAPYPSFSQSDRLLFESRKSTGQANQLSSTSYLWRVKAAAHAAVWQLQNPNKPFEALTNSVV